MSRKFRNGKRRLAGNRESSVPHRRDFRAGCLWGTGIIAVLSNFGTGGSPFLLSGRKAGLGEPPERGVARANQSAETDPLLWGRKGDFKQPGSSPPGRSRLGAEAGGGRRTLARYHWETMNSSRSAKSCGRRPASSPSGMADCPWLRIHARFERSTTVSTPLS